MRNTFTINFLSALANLLICTFGAALLYDGWFDEGDHFYTYVYWSFFLSGILFVSGKRIILPIRIIHWWPRILLIIVIALLLSFGWTFFVLFIWEPGSYLNGFPIINWWNIGTLIQLLLLNRYLPAETTKIKIVNGIYGILLFALLPMSIVMIMNIFYIVHDNLNRPDKEIYLIPYNFKGYFRVVRGEQCGIVPRVENENRILEIPQNGILIIQPDSDNGIDTEYYLVETNGKRHRINELDDNEILNGPGIVVRFQGGKLDLTDSNAFFIETQCEDFEVLENATTKKEWVEVYKIEHQLDSLTDVLLQECRSKPMKFPLSAKEPVIDAR